MSGKNIYDELAKMIDEEDITGGMPATPSFLKLLRLQFTHTEAEMAVKIRTTGGTLDQLSEKLGMEKAKLEKKLMIMADKGTILYDPEEENPIYKAVAMTAGGLTETGLWGNIRFPYTVELGKVINQVSREHGEHSLSKLGFAYTPVWAAETTLPEDAQPSENLMEAVKEAGHWSVSMCPCRLSRALVKPDDPCKHMMETCVHTGALSRYAVKHGMARELTHDELGQVLRKCNEDGLVHTINLLGQICNCCEDCCPIFGTYKMGVPTFERSPFMANVNEDECIECGLCGDRCPVDAITVKGVAAVDQEVCIGCGVCVTTCKPESMKLVRRS